MPSRTGPEMPVGFTPNAGQEAVLRLMYDGLSPSPEGTIDVPYVSRPSMQRIFEHYKTALDFLGIPNNVRECVLDQVEVTTKNRRGDPRYIDTLKELRNHIKAQ